VIVGDIQSSNDARRLQGKGAKVHQIETKSSCHLHAEQVGNVFHEVIDKKTKASEKWLSSRNHDISDVIPLPKQFYKEIKKVLKSEVGKTISYKGWKSYGQCYAFSNMGRNTLQKIIQKHPELPAELHELAFNDIFWDCVEKIERKKFEGLE